MSRLIWIYSLPYSPSVFNMIQFELNFFGNFADVILLSAFSFNRLIPPETSSSDLVEFSPNCPIIKSHERRLFVVVLFSIDIYFHVYEYCFIP